MNILYYGDNLEILRRYVNDESVDLIYLDPPFNSNASYNILFKESTGEASAAQIKAFEDTWHWGDDAEWAFHEIVQHAPTQVVDMIRALRGFVGRNDMMAYLAMMTIRLQELHRVLKPTGSLYLHCDPTASHYLKIVLDAIFGHARFLNEVTWRRSSAHSDTKQGMRRYGNIRDILLVYTKSAEYTWNPLYTPYTEEYLKSEYRHVTPDGRRYKETDVTAAKPGGDTEYEWHVKRARLNARRWQADLSDEYKSPNRDWVYKSVGPYKGRYWAYSKGNLVEFAKQGALIHRETGMPRLMQFSDTMPGIPLQNLWDDIPPASGYEDFGYATQKPLALLDRIIRASSNEGDLILDPFCGCGTAVAAAHMLKKQRRWIGIDVTHLAVGLMKLRLNRLFGLEPGEDYEVIGEPADASGAKQLFEEDPYQFQYWALSLVEARPLQQKKGRDRGVDGTIYFLDGPRRSPHKIIVQVKGGHVAPSQVRDLKGVLDREQAPLGLFITRELPTKEMETEAASAGFYHSDLMGRNYPKIQIRTVEQLLQGQRFNLPPRPLRFAQAQRVKTQEGTQTSMLEVGEARAVS